MIYSLLKLNLTPLKIYETIYADLIDSCRLPMMKLGRPVLRHTLRQANQVVDFLSKIGAKLRSSSKASIMLTPRDHVIPLIKAFLRTTYNKLTCFGNLYVIASMGNNVTI